MHSFATWDRFRAASGNGTNRKTLVKIFLRVESPQSFPYLKETRDWLVYGVDVVPVTEDFTDHLEARPVVSKNFEKVGECFPLPVRRRDEHSIMGFNSVVISENCQ